MSYTPPVGNAVELTFVDPAATNADLVFGAAVVIDSALVTIGGVLPGISGLVYVLEPCLGVVVGTLPGLTGSAQVSYDNAVARPLTVGTSSSWQQATPAPLVMSVTSGTVQRLHTPLDTRWQLAQRLQGQDVTVAIPNALQLLRVHVSSRWQPAQRLASDPAKQRWSNADRVRQVRSSAWQPGQRRQSDPARAVWQNCLHDRRQVRTARWQPATALRMVRQDRVSAGKALFSARRSPFQQGMRPPAGRSTWIPIVPPFDPCYLPADGDQVALVFVQGAATDADLVFVCDRHPLTPPAGVTVPVRRIYVVQNEVSLRRVDGDIAIDCPSLQLSIDADSWCWGFSASVPGSELAKLDPASYGEPVELEAIVNGTSFRILAESISRDRTFGRSALRVSGRGRAAVLDAPYAAARTFGSDVSATVQQLAEQALTVAGVPSGWLIDFGPDDWLIPAGVWSHQGSPISAINRIAEAAGAYVQAHPSDDTLLILPRYPVGPWDWATATPDFELPSAVVQREGIEWVDRAVYNRAFVSGSTTGGVLAEITRTGTAGDQVAAMVTDALCTTLAAGRQRAMPILANVGRQATVSLRLPVLPETGVIRPGALVRYVDGSVTRVGMVRGATVGAGRPQVWQTIGVQTYA